MSQYLRAVSTSHPVAFKLFLLLDSKVYCCYRKQVTPNWVFPTPTHCTYNAISVNQDLEQAGLDINCRGHSKPAKYFYNTDNPHVHVIIIVSEHEV